MANRYNSLIKPAKSIINQSRRQGFVNAYMKFPETLGAHAIVLNFKQYSFRQNVTNTIDQTGSVVLPLPQSMAENFDVRLQGADLGLSGAIASDVASYVKNTGGNGEKWGEDLADLIKDTVKGIAGMDNDGTWAKDFASMQKYLMRGGLDSIAPGSGGAIDRTFGTSINPHVAVNFDGMNLKTHTFAWQLAPSTPSESDTLRDIQNFIRRNITPSYGAGYSSKNSAQATAGRAILKYPSMVDIFFVGIDQAYFYYFKRCMVQNFAIDYTPQQQHTILTGGKPAFMNMTMTLTESQIHTQDDYTDPEPATPTINPHTR